MRNKKTELLEMLYAALHGGANWYLDNFNGRCVDIKFIVCYVLQQGEKSEKMHLRFAFRVWNF